METIVISDLIKKLNTSLSKDCIFRLDLVHSTPIRNNGTEAIRFVGYVESIVHDYSWIPKFSLTWEDKQKVLEVVRYVNKKLFTEMLYLVLNGKLECYTEFVRKRIVYNMIFKLDCLSTQQKEEWNYTFNKVYHKRKTAIYDYYIKEVIQLPF